ncbi:MAG: alpha/beta hydrolase [Pirellulaceae bacterium]
MRSLVALLLFAPSLLAAEPRLKRDIPYAEPRHERRMLDVYAPAEGKEHPIVVWIHGGGWRKGDKSDVAEKPRAFVEKGYVFVSINYRFFPQVRLQEMTADVAQAVRWVHDHGREYGGDPDRIFVMGHSAGAHLAALVSTDHRYLKQQGLSLSSIKGCVPIDTAVYDVARQIARVEAGEPRRAASYRETFGDGDSQRQLSPVTHAAADKGVPPFLVMCVADREDAVIQSKLLVEALEKADVAADLLAAEGKTHRTIDAELGLPDDPPTEALFAFVNRVLSVK